MFHTYITASSGRKIDFDRAAFLMDNELLADVMRRLIKRTCPDGFDAFNVAIDEAMGNTMEIKANGVWHSYCRAHEAKYGEPFAPNVDPTWDL